MRTLLLIIVIAAQGCGQQTIHSRPLGDCNPSKDTGESCYDRVYWSHGAEDYMQLSCEGDQHPKIVAHPLDKCISHDSRQFFTRMRLFCSTTVDGIRFPNIAGDCFPLYAVEPECTLKMSDAECAEAIFESEERKNN